MSVVEVGQYFVTRNASEFQRTIACREYTLPRDDQASQPKGWIRGNTRIGPILEVTTSFQHFKYGIEVRIQSVNEDNSHSWVRISYRTVRYVNEDPPFWLRRLVVARKGVFATSYRMLKFTSISTVKVAHSSGVTSFLFVSSG